MERKAMENKKTDSLIMWERGRFFRSSFTKVMIINILFNYSFAAFKRFGNALIVVYLVSPNLNQYIFNIISITRKFILY